MKNTEIRELSDTELVEKIQDEKTHLIRMKLNHAVSPLENANILRETKKDIARLKTELKSRKIAKKNS